MVFLSNTTDGEGGTYGNEVEIIVNGITPSLPYNETEARTSSSDVVPVVGNTTILNVEGGVWSGAYVRLVVEGCWEDDGEGATVGEFVLIGG